jgi:hypothetical protein
VTEWKRVIEGDATYSLDVGDCRDFGKSLPDDSIDLLIFSPPYEDARRYPGMTEKPLKGEAWVRRMFGVVTTFAPKVKGLIAIVCNGRTKQFNYSGTPELLFADLKRAGFNMRKSPLYKRHGIFGSGSVDWLKDCYEPILCVTRPGRLPWSDNKACGHPPKFGPGGDPSHRKQNGERVKRKRYTPPALANPGNIIECSGGHLGHDLAHDNEAPFPTKLSDFFVKSFCPPGGVVADIMCGGGTTLQSCLTHGRRFIGCDLRESQKDLSERRAADVLRQMATIQQITEVNS